MPKRKALKVIVDVNINAVSLFIRFIYLSKHLLDEVQ